jgi:hypothetical protein
MFRFLSGVPKRLKNIFSHFKQYFTKPQYNNFCRTELALIAASKKEHDITSLNELFIDRNNQSTLNRFFTNPKWNHQNLLPHAKNLLLQETNKQQPSLQIPSLTPNTEHRSIDDTVCRKYSTNTQMTCINYSSTMGKVLSHDYVTSVYHNDQIKIPDNIKLYGSKTKCEQKGMPFKTKIELACEIIDEHIPLVKQSVMHWDSWYMCKEVVEHCKRHGYRWIGDIKSNRIVYYQNVRFNLCELYDHLCEAGRFVDVVVDGEIYLACSVVVYVAEIGNVCILINVKAGTNDLHFLCSDLVELSVFELVEMALRRHVIEEVHKEVKALGLGEYQFQQSEAALIHAHLVCLAFVLLYILRLRLLRYGTKNSLLTTDATVKWVRGQAGNMFVHMIRDSKESTRKLQRRINTK